MNREIKFRGKSYFDGRWIFGDLFHTIGTTGDGLAIQYYDDEDGWMTEDIKDVTIGQFTGLKDSEGQEIYEGDILTWRSIICEEDPVETWELPVTFYNGCFCLNDDFDMTLISVIYDSEEFGGVKIIGNIHDNPKLLEGGPQ